MESKTERLMRSAMPISIHEVLPISTDIEIFIPTLLISGAQRGADLGALKGAAACGIPTGGFAPKGWRTESGALPEFPYKMCYNQSYMETSECRRKKASEYQRAYREARSPEQIKAYKAYCHEAYMRRKKRLRDAIHAILGNVCIRCGFADKRALHVDHINGDGRIDRNRWGSYRTKGALLKLIIEDSSRFQILCANCNWIKLIENGESPGGPGGNKKNPIR